VDIIATVTLPEDTPSSLTGTLRFDGACEQNPSVTDFRMVTIRIRPWHSMKLANITLSNSNPVENELFQVSAKLRNMGNCPSNYAVAAFLDGKPVRLRADGASIDPNATLRLERGKFALLSVEWKAKYGHHNFLIDALDLGENESANATTIANDSRVVHIFVNVNLKDWVPFIIIGLGVAVALGIAAYKYRVRIRTFIRAHRKPKGGTKPAAGKGGKGNIRVGRIPPGRPPGGKGPAPPKRPPSMSERFRAGMRSIQARAAGKGPPPAAFVKEEE
jgi:hypothetical protein